MWKPLGTSGLEMALDTVANPEVFNAVAKFATTVVQD